MNANPLLVPSDLPYQLPRFADIRDEHFIPAFDAAIAEHTAEIAAIATNPEPANWENTVEALEWSGQALGRVHAVFANLYGTDASEALDAVATDITPKLAAHSDSVYQNADLYARIQAVTPPPGDEESSRLHAYLLRAFRRRGADLSTDAKAELVSINQRLSVLSDEFSKNLLSETNALAVDLSEGELAGFDASRRQAAAAAATALGRTGYVVPLDLPTVQADQAVLERASARMALYEASQKRGTGSNVPVLLEMVRLRARRAEMLGYASHADYVIEEETAGSADAARTLQTLAGLKSGGLEVGRVLEERELYVADWRGLIDLLNEHPRGEETALVLGHEPTISLAARMLASGGLSARTDFGFGFSTAMAVAGTVPAWGGVAAGDLRVERVLRPSA